MNVVVDVSGGDGSTGVSGTGKELCSGEAFFLRGMSRGRFFSCSALNDIPIAEGMVGFAVLSSW